jgi:hypothetical protein
MILFPPKLGDKGGTWGWVQAQKRLRGVFLGYCGQILIPCRRGSGAEEFSPPPAPIELRHKAGDPFTWPVWRLREKKSWCTWPQGQFSWS